jgi:hypothetical protein
VSALTAVTGARTRPRAPRGLIDANRSPNSDRTGRQALLRPRFRR